MRRAGCGHLSWLPPRHASAPLRRRSTPTGHGPTRADVLPWVSCRRADPFALNQFARQLDVSLAAGTTQIIDRCRHAMTGRFGNPYIARDYGVVDLRAHILPYIGGDLVR